MRVYWDLLKPRERQENDFCPLFFYLRNMELMFFSESNRWHPKKTRADRRLAWRTGKVSSPPTSLDLRFFYSFEPFGLRHFTGLWVQCSNTFTAQPRNCASSAVCKAANNGFGGKPVTKENVNFGIFFSVGKFFTRSASRRWRACWYNWRI